MRSGWMIGLFLFGAACASPEAGPLEIRSEGALACLDTDDATRCAWVAREDHGCFFTGAPRPELSVPRFGGHAMGTSDGEVHGRWHTRTPDGDRLEADIDYVRCWEGGAHPSRAPARISRHVEWRGVGAWNDQPGHLFLARGSDRSDAADLVDEFTIQVWSPDGTLVYQGGHSLRGTDFRVDSPVDGAPYDSDLAADPAPPAPPRGR